MKAFILQYSTTEPERLAMMEMSKSFNKPYSDKFGFEYVLDSTRRCNDRSVYWEKLAFIIEFLKTAEEGSLVVWEDVDSLNIGDEDIRNILKDGQIFGMVQMMAGLNHMKPIKWYNAGVIALINCKIVRDFLDLVWATNLKTDEDGLNQELKKLGFSLGGKPVAIEPKWNCWSNNNHLCSNPVIKSWHAMVDFNEKIQAMRDFIEQRS